MASLSRYIFLRQGQRSSHHSSGSQSSDMRCCQHLMLATSPTWSLKLVDILPHEVLSLSKSAKSCKVKTSRVKVTRSRDRNCNLHTYNPGATRMQNVQIWWVFTYVGAYPEIWIGGARMGGISSPPSSFSSPPLRSRPLNPAREPGERCKLPQWGLGRSPQPKFEFGTV